MLNPCIFNNPARHTMDKNRGDSVPFKVCKCKAMFMRRKCTVPGENDAHVTMATPPTSEEGCNDFGIHLQKKFHYHHVCHIYIPANNLTVVCSEHFITRPKVMIHIQIIDQ